MRPCKPLGTTLTTGLTLVGVVTPACATDPDDSRLAVVRDWVIRGWQAAENWILDGYSLAPVLMVGLSVLALIPPLAIAGYLVNRASRFRNDHRRMTLPTGEAAGKGLGWPLDVWIRVESEGHAPERRRLPRELMSIGRAEDNDLVLGHPTVHRHHAVVNRSEDAQIVIRDLSGEGGNGVRINGERVTQATLADGDRIALGKVLLVLETRPA